MTDWYAVTYAAAVLALVAWVALSVRYQDKILFDFAWPQLIAWAGTAIVLVVITVEAARHIIG